MIDKTKDNNLDSEIAKRLDDLFGEGDDGTDEDLPSEADDQILAENEPQLENQPVAEAEIVDLQKATADRADKKNVPDDYLLAELKNLVLSIDWEITEEALADFLSEIDGLRKSYQDEKIILMFLQLLASLGQYIKTNRGNAHPKTFKILNSVFSRLEEVVLSEDMPAADKKNLLRAEMQKYKQLRNKVSKKKAVSATRKDVQTKAKAKPQVAAATYQEAELQDQTNASVIDAAEPEVPPSSEMLAKTIEELKRYIQSEFDALKQELKKLQKSN